MALPVLICDDSSFARKQLARALPANWDVDVCFAENGQQALEIIEQKQADVMFLDLNMPVMDGFELMEIIHQRELPCMVIVVSSDAQPEAMERVKRLGVMDFIRKPVTSSDIADLLVRFGLLANPKGHRQVEDMAIDRYAVYREVANVSMGKAAEQLAGTLGVMVDLSLPEAFPATLGEIGGRLENSGLRLEHPTIVQGFVSKVLNGEAMVTCNYSSYADLVGLMGGYLFDPSAEREVLMDLSSMLIGACLAELTEQFDLPLQQGTPQLYPSTRMVVEHFQENEFATRQVLTIAFEFNIKTADIRFHLIMMFTEQSHASFNEMVDYLVAS